jgi:hypothetical protein
MRGECLVGGACECCRCPSALESTSCTSATKKGEANAIRGVPLLRAAALHFFPGAGAELSYVKLLWLVATSHYYRLTAPSAIGHRRWHGEIIGTTTSLFETGPEGPELEGKQV